MSLKRLQIGCKKKSWNWFIPVINEIFVNYRNKSISRNLFLPPDMFSHNMPLRRGLSIRFFFKKTLIFLLLTHFFTKQTLSNISNIVQMLLILLIFYREFRRQSCDWLYSHVQKRFHNFGSAKVIKSVGFNRKFYILWKVISRIYYTISYLKYYIYNICT